MVALPRSARLVLVASPGRRLVELARLAEALDARPDSAWVSIRTPESESVLAGRSVAWLPAGPGAARCGPVVARLLTDPDLTALVGTGGAVAVPAVLAALTAGREAHFVETSDRTRGPSAAGRLVAAHPRTRLWTHHLGPGWGPRWHRDIRMDGVRAD
ncbi:hypothetical protein ACFFKU_17590 [Kineococcus gynurae]|uniref:Oligosaccharide biosynthesis protein Alg14 n=1 Tax=Kineococcus gynurae TaxID=452979 RepID=A0ABV5LNQ2_9ACTN